MSALTEILRRQHAWATARGIELDPPDHAAQLTDNLFRPLSYRAQGEFSGAEQDPFASSYFPGEPRLWTSCDLPECRFGTPSNRSATPFQREIDQFAEAVDGALGFRGATYQEIYSRLLQIRNRSQDHADYLGSRYFRVQLGG